MGKLTYMALMSLDGYVADEEGKWDWARPDAEVHAFVNDLERRADIHLYGRRMYEVLVAWESMDLAGQPDPIRDYAEIWRSADKIVYSRSLEEASSARTRIEREFDPDAVRSMKEATERDIHIAGPELAGQAIEAGLVDELHLLIAPVVVGGGKRFLPDGARARLELLDQRRFGNGMAYVHYRIG